MSGCRGTECRKQSQCVSAAYRMHLTSLAQFVMARFVYHQSVNVGSDLAVSRIAQAIGEPARARMLFSLLDGHARTSTELATVAEVSPSTASVHLNRLKAEHLVRVSNQGKHRYYSLEGEHVATVLEGLSVLAGRPQAKFVPNTPSRLRVARTCYDHLAGTLGVLLYDCLQRKGWILPIGEDSCELTARGANGFAELGTNVEEMRARRRRFAYACLDWSERRPHLGGAVGAALLTAALKQRWVTQDLDSRALEITSDGRREMLARFGLKI